jgi:hypothetical protein
VEDITVIAWFLIAGVAAGLTVAFWQQIVTWANQTLAGWLSDLFGDELRDAFLLLLAAADRSMVLVQRALTRVQARLVRARILFRQLQQGREHQKVVRAEMRRDDGQIIEMEAAEIVPWHELPDEVREKFIRRHATTVEMELRLKE